jgi:hypothetical protein
MTTFTRAVPYLRATWHKLPCHWQIKLRKEANEMIDDKSKLVSRIEALSGDQDYDVGVFVRESKVGMAAPATLTHSNGWRAGATLAKIVKLIASPGKIESKS